MSIGRSLFLLLAVCCLTWLGVLWTWQGRTAELQEADLVKYLVLLPLTLFVLALAARWAWNGVRSAAAASEGDAAAHAAPAAEPPAGNDEERRRTWRVVQTGVALPMAEQPQDVLDAARDGEPLPQPDAELVDTQGLPVLSVRSAQDWHQEADSLWQEVPDFVQSAAWRALDNQGGPSPAWLRALGMAHQALEQPLQYLQEWATLAAEYDPVHERPAQPLRLLLVCEPTWSPAEQEAMRELVLQWTAHALAPQAERWELLADVVGGSSEALWLKADQVLLSAARMGQPLWGLMLGMSSSLDQTVVDRWSAQGCLLVQPEQPRGRVPSEAAAALLLAPEGWAPWPDADDHSVYLHRPAVARRDKPIEAPGKVDHLVLQAVFDQAVQTADLPAEQVANVLCDADRHSNRATELYGVALERTPHLDPVEDMALLAAVTGHLGCASALVSVAAAAAWSAKEAKPCVVLSQADAHDRMALVVKPGVTAN
jgi:hypothetical protein